MIKTKDVKCGVDHKKVVNNSGKFSGCVVMM